MRYLKLAMAALAASLLVACGTKPVAPHDVDIYGIGKKVRIDKELLRQCDGIQKPGGSDGIAIIEFVDRSNSVIVACASNNSSLIKLIQEAFNIPDADLPTGRIKPKDKNLQELRTTK